MAKKEVLYIEGAREHNLKNVFLEIPRNAFVVITGLSGSGKSSLAFDTIYAEGQRRYVESLSAYARQFLGQMEKPDVDSIEGLSPAIAIEQKSTHNNPRSTVGTVTEIYDYLRLLFARVGHPYCSQCGRPVSSQSVDQIVDSLLGFEPGRRLQILAPIIRGKKGEHQDIFERVRKDGFTRLQVNGEIKTIDELKETKLAKNKKHNISIVVDRIVLKEGIRSRLADSVEIALHHGEGTILLLHQAKDQSRDDPWEEKLLSTNLYCPYCDISFPRLEPRSFSFNSPHGACPTCDGLGVIMDFDPDLILPDKSLSLLAGAVRPWGNPPISPWYQTIVHAMARKYRFAVKTPWQELPSNIKKKFLYGTGSERLKYTWEKEDGSFDFHRPYEGIIPNLRRRYHETKSERMRQEFHKYIMAHTCETCHGNRLQPFPAAVRIGDKATIGEITKMSVDDAMSFFDGIELAPIEEKIASEVIKEIRSRINFLYNVGLSYLTLERSAGTLSGGEAQRIRLATQIGSRLMGVMYVLDEPSIGLHQKDNDRLVHTLKELKDLGNTVLVVEHDRDTIMAADYVVDLGPGAGLHGGYVVARGTPQQIMRSKDSLTGQYLADKKRIEIPDSRRPGNGYSLMVRGARENNLKDINVTFPLNKLICVTGVSGSGKSTLVNEILYKISARKLMRAQLKGGECQAIYGLEHLDKVINIDQSPIGRTPRSNPATYTGMFTPIRELFARLPESKLRGYKPGRFSFNVSGGRCESCEGDGIKKIEMHFLPDLYITCEVCQGRRYNHETLEVRYKGKSIYDVLEMNVEQALDFFENIPAVRSKLMLLNEVGLDYIKLGQSATTLSGGEAQRIKLAAELAKRATGRTLYILDEPTTGLHFDDIRKLLHVLNRLVDTGNTVVVIEHNLDVIKHADWIVDLGPEGGDGGGEVLCEGTPEKLASSGKSYTGRYLAQVLPETLAADHG